MTVKKVKYNDTFIYLDDEVNDEDRDYVIHEKENELSDTLEFKPISDEELLDKTLVDVDLFGGKDE